MEAATVAAFTNVALTALALGAASWAARSTYQALGLERRRDARRDLAEWASQAAQVAAWAIHDSNGTWQISVANRSGVPVYGLTVTFHSPKRPTEQPVHAVGLLPPGELSLPYPRVWLHETEPDGDGNTRQVQLVDNIAVNVMFTDALGAVWQRNEKGHLQLASGHDALWFTDSDIWPGSASGRPRE